MLISFDVLFVCYLVSAWHYSILQDYCSDCSAPDFASASNDLLSACSLGCNELHRIIWQCCRCSFIYLFIQFYTPFCYRFGCCQKSLTKVFALSDNMLHDRSQWIMVGCTDVQAIFQAPNIVSCMPGRWQHDIAASLDSHCFVSPCKQKNTWTTRKKAWAHKKAWARIHACTSWHIHCLRMLVQQGVGWFGIKIISITVHSYTRTSTFPCTYIDIHGWSWMSPFQLAQKKRTRGSGCLSCWRWDVENLLTCQLRPDQVESLLSQFPDRKFILVGDSGEKDPEASSETLTVLQA